MFQVIRRKRLYDFQSLPVDVNLALDRSARFGAVLAVGLHLRRKSLFRQRQIDFVKACNVLNNLMAVSRVVQVTKVRCKAAISP